jgi:hypothetical protein
MATSISQALGVAAPPTRQAALPVPDAGAGYESQATLKRKELEPLQQRISEAQTEATKLAGEKATFETEQKAKQAAGESQAMRSFEERVQAAPMRPMLEQKTAQEKDFFFRPSQEDGLMMAGLASLITVLGTSVGRGGKGYAQAALAGMNGMMQGYRQGRDDVFRQEKAAFETNARALRDQISSIRQALQDYEKEAARDRDGALLRLREKLTQEGADFAAARVNRQGVVTMLPELMRQERALNDQIGRYEMKAVDARTRAEAAEAARVAREEAAITLRGMTQPRPGKPVEVIKPDGTKTMIRPSFDESGEMVLPEGYKLSPRQSAGQYAQVFANRMYGNILGASADIGNIIGLPASAELPVFSGLLEADPQKIIQSMVRFGAAEITEQQARLFQQVSSQLGAALARLEGQGLASAGSQSNIRSFNAMRPVAGDKAINMAMYIARVKQEIETGIRVHRTMHGASEEQRQEAQKELDKLNRIIPFSVEDVMKVARQNKEAALSDKMQRLLQQPFIATQLQAPREAGSASAPGPAAAGTPRRAQLNGREIEVRGGKWVYVDTGEEAK